MHIQGTRCTSISDHYAVFHAASNVKTDDAQIEMTLLNVIWGKSFKIVLNETQLAYNKFHEAIPVKQNACCFPYSPTPII